MAEMISFTPGQVVSWDDLNAIMAQHGSPQGAKSVVKLTLTKEEREALEDAGLSPENHGRYRYYFEDGSYVDAETQTPNSGEIDAQGQARGTFRVIDYKPSQRFQQTQRRQEQQEQQTGSAPKEGDTRGPQTGPKREVWRNGAWTLEDNPLYQAETETAKPDRKQVTGSDGKVYNVVTTIGPNGTPTTTVYAPDGTPAPGNVVPGAAKDDQKPTSASVTEALDGHPGWRVTKRASKDAQGNSITETVYIDPQGKEHPTPPEKPGKRYTQVTQDKDTGKWFGLTPEGTWEEMPGGPGATPAGTGAGPRLPALIVGQSEAAIRAYHNQLGEEVAAGRMTPAQRANRLQEALQVAGIAMQEAGLAQRQLESARNTGFNIASTRLDYFGNGFTNAIKFVSDLNGKLPPGSSLGGDAFVAMLTMQMAIAQRSGIMDLEIPDEALTPEARARRQQQRANLPTPRLTDPTNPTKVAEDRERALADPVFTNGVSNTTDAGGVPREYTPSSATNAPSSATNAPSSATNAPSSAPAQPEAPSAPALPEPIFRPAPPAVPAPAPVAPTPTPAPAPSPAMTAPPPPPAPLPTAPADMLGDPPPVPANVAPGMMSPNPPGIRETPMPVNPGPGEPGHRPGEPVGQMPDFPVLAGLRPQVPVQQPQPVPYESPAMLRSMAASTPPWRLSNEQIQQMLAMGIDEDTIFSVPRPRVGVGA